MTDEVSNSLEDWFEMPKTCRKGHELRVGNVYIVRTKRRGLIEECRRCNLDRKARLRAIKQTTGAK